MKSNQIIQRFEYLNREYKIIYHGVSINTSGLIEIQELIDLNWWQRLFRTDGQERIWKKIYFGHIALIQETMNVYNTALIMDKKLKNGKHETTN